MHHARRATAGRLARTLAALGLSASAGCGALGREHRPAAAPPPLTPVLHSSPAAAAAPPAKHEVRVSQFLFCSDFEIKKDAPIFSELTDLREQVYRELKLPPASSLVKVYLFDARERYERFMQARYPELPKRRAFFIAQPRAVGGADELLVYTFAGDHIRQDLRHELTHALLHSVLKDVPLWLDEGLAEYFELPPEHRGVNAKHVEELCAAPARSDLGRLEQLGQVQQMAQGEYREAWAWVHLMLHTTPELRDVLLGYLQQLRTNPTPGPLHPRLAAVCADVDARFASHIAGLDRRAARH